MNERIKKLMEESVSFRFDPDSLAYEAQVDPEDLEYFAELIVRECAEVALEQKKWVEDQKVCNPRDKEWNLARIQQSQRIVDKIKEHFGVEE